MEQVHGDSCHGCHYAGDGVQLVTQKNGLASCCFQLYPTDCNLFHAAPTGVIEVGSVIFQSVGNFFCS